MMKKLILIAVLLAWASVALAADVLVHWTTPSTRTDGSSLTNLVSVEVFWGTCLTTSPPVFGQELGAKDFQTTLTGVNQSGWITPTGNGPFCIDATAIDSIGDMSAPSNVVAWTPPLALGQPVKK